jgi:hypothetical protein
MSITKLVDNDYADVFSIAAERVSDGAEVDGIRSHTVRIYAIDRMGRVSAVRTSFELNIQYFTPAATDTPNVMRLEERDILTAL